MNKWTLLATVTFIAVLGACYTLLSHQSAHASGPSPDASDDVDLEDDGQQDKSDNVYTLDDEANEGGSRVAAVKSGSAAAESGRKKVETIEDEEENGVTVERGEVFDDDEGVLEPAATAPPKDAPIAPGAPRTKP